MHNILIILFIIFTGCSVKPLEPIKVEITHNTIDYIKDIKPILDKRCVVCHSCYNSPCQLKLSSFEGLDRGSSKERVYLGDRLRAQDPSRLFIDAKNTLEWREKGFNSVSNSSSKVGTNNSLMLLLLEHKMQNPQSTGEYFSESDDLVCAKNQKELAKFLSDNPNQGMPFGFPPLTQDEYTDIKQWLAEGAKSPTVDEIKSQNKISNELKKEIAEFEKFFNMQDAKHIMSARYIYEHLFLAHLSFENSPEDFFELVRSTTPSSQPIDIIATLRPYDDPKVDKFYYRFRKIDSTIVHKTHMVYNLSYEKLKRYKEIFIKPTWNVKPYIFGYKKEFNARPFTVYAQIPALSRYLFLLDNAEYMVRTFIRGPVCKGQIALNVIEDQTWVMFMDPKYDLSVQNKNYLKDQYNNLTMPIVAGSNVALLNTFSDKYIDLATKYSKYREKTYDAFYKDGLGMQSIWRGKDASSSPFLTIYRHFDSASVQKGVIGSLSKTVWVVDFPILERIYYALVAGFDVYGNVGHQASVRRYASRLRLEGETNFLNLLPKKDRETIFNSWYIGSASSEKHFLSKTKTKIKYTTKNPKRELIEHAVGTHLLKSCNISFDSMNYYKSNEKQSKLPQKFITKEDYNQAFRSLTKKGLAFIKIANGQNTNLAFIRIKNIPNREDMVISAIVNRWHDNVSYMFFEKDRLDSSKDKFNFYEGFVGSYPNQFLVVECKDLLDFFDMLSNYDGTRKYVEKFLKYGVNRGNDNFWQTYDWFQERFYRDDPHQAGLFDLNRYYYKVIK